MPHLPKCNRAPLTTLCEDNNEQFYPFSCFDIFQTLFLVSMEYFTVQQQIFSPTATLPVRVLDILHIILNFSLMNSNQVCSDKVCVPGAYNKMDVPRSDSICNICIHTATLYVICILYYTRLKRPYRAVQL